MRVTFSGRAKRGGIKTPYCLLVLSFSKTVLSSCFGVSTAYTVKAYGFSTPENNFIFVVTRRRSFREVVKLFEKFSLKRATFSVDSYSCAQEHFKLKSSWKEKSAVFRFWGYSNTRFWGANTHFYGRSAFSDAFFKNLARRLFWCNGFHIFLPAWNKQIRAFFNTKSVRMQNYFSGIWATWKIQNASLPRSPSITALSLRRGSKIYVFESWIGPGFHSNSNSCWLPPISPGTPGVLPYISYIGTFRQSGCHFQGPLSWAGYTISHFHVLYRVVPVFLSFSPPSIT